MPGIASQPVKPNTSQEKEVIQSIPNAPPKRNLPPIARPQPTQSQQTPQHPSSTAISPSNPSDASPPSTKPIPPNVLAAHRKPLKHIPEHGVPVASLQLRSYSVRNLEFFADFALRAAYYLRLPASGPVPLPRITERWTMPRANFVHKKSQENFERITLRRVITIMDGEKSAVEVWLAFLRKHQFYGLGMKAHVWEWEGLDVAGKMDKQFAEMEADLDAKLANFGFNKSVAKDKSLVNMMYSQGKRQTAVPMSQVRDASRTAKQTI